MGKDVQGNNYKEAAEKRRKMLVEEWTQEKNSAGNTGTPGKGKGKK